ncbi:hypothetical protein [Micromonospora sp. NPDC004551]|uniref:hypothetical protein n=1 Tax=Micromonospora sp. NPDC004551 TaxID=3154284 RepID=UPI0033BC39B8
MNSDQVQAAASVAATALTGGVLWWEVHSRNRERRDAERAQARLVASWVKNHYDSEDGDVPRLVGVDVVVANLSAAPIMDLLVYLYQAPDGRRALTKRFGHVLRAGVSTEFRYTLPEPLPWRRSLPDPFARVALGFTDAAGLRWRREDDGTPSREVTGVSLWVNVREQLSAVRWRLRSERTRHRLMVESEPSLEEIREMAEEDSRFETLADTER